MFHQLRGKMKEMVTMKKKSDPMKFVVHCIIAGLSYPNALCDTCSSMIIMPRVMTNQLSLNIEPFSDSLTFMDYSKVDSRENAKDLQVKNCNVIVLVDFHVMDIQIDQNSSLLLGRDFMAIVGVVRDMQTNKLCLTFVDKNVFYDHV